jgi:hypothetical protein
LGKVFDFSKQKTTSLLKILSRTIFERSEKECVNRPAFLHRYVKHS